MTQYETMATRIVLEQSRVIGPLAYTEAARVDGIHVEATDVLIEASASARDVIDTLVGRYERLFGKASVEVCKDATVHLRADMAPEDVPARLRA